MVRPPNITIWVEADVSGGSTSGKNAGGGRGLAVTASQGATGPVQTRYAGALYDLAAERRELDRTVDEAASLARLIDESPELARMLASPVVPAADGRRAISAVLESQGFSLLIRHFVGVVAANRRLAALRSILGAFAGLAAARRGIVTAAVATAHKLTDVQRAQIAARLATAGYSNVRIDETVDPSLLGGLTLRVGARLFDASIKSRLQRLAYRMKGAA